MASTSSSAYSHYLEVAVQAAKEAGAVIATAFNEPKAVENKKNFADLVTQTDQQCEQMILARLQQAFPEHKFIGEETVAAEGASANVLTDEPTWMCDPLDGTTNFVHGFPFVCTSLGLVINRQVVVGVVYNPILDELFTACRGGGAHLNGKPISVSNAAELTDALLATEIGTGRDEDTMRAVFERVQRLTRSARSLRCCGSCAMNLAGVACGRLDAFYEIGFGGCWDVAAGALIVEEAGGVVVDPCGSSFGLMSRRVLAGNRALAAKVAAEIAACKASATEPLPPK